MSPLSQIIASFLMYGVGKLHNPSIAPWRILYLICGAATMVSGILFYIAMPSTPDKAWFLTPRERELVVARMKRDREGGDKTSLSMPQVREALLDPRTWFAFIFGFVITLAGAVIVVS